jgi:hypothetical protein
MPMVRYRKVSGRTTISYMFKGPIPKKIIPKMELPHTRVLIATELGVEIIRRK